MLDNIIMLTSSIGFVDKIVLDSLVKRNYHPVINSPPYSGKVVLCC